MKKYAPGFGWGGPLAAVAEIALGLGLEVWYSPTISFVSTFIDGWASTHSETPLYDLDMSGMGLVKTCARGRGTTYPDMPWEPKEAFWAVAAYYGREAGPAIGAQPGPVGCR